MIVLRTVVCLYSFLCLCKAIKCKEKKNLWYTATYALISCHPRGLTPGSPPGTYEGIGGDLLTFVANVWPGTGALDRLCTSEARYRGKDPRDL